MGGRRAPEAYAGRPDRRRRRLTRRRRTALRGSLRTLSAVVFDCDGLLLDTEECWTRAESSLFRRYGRAFDLDAKRALLGTALDVSGRVLERLLDQPGAADELGAELYELVLAEVRGGAAPLPGAAELVADLRATRPLGVASNSPRELVEAALGAAGLAATFDLVLTGDDVERPKPAPDIYLRACELLDARPSDSIALEDSPTGVAAGRAAGLFVIGVPSLPDLELDADLTAPSLEDGAVRRAILDRGIP